MKSRLNPFTIRRSYNTTLPLTEIRQVLREQSTKGLLSAAGNSSLILNGDTFKLVTYVQKWGISISGTIRQEQGAHRMDICYRMRFNPLFLFLPVLLVIVYGILKGRSFHINGTPASRAGFALAASILYLFFVAILSLMFFWLITAKRHELERLLVLDRIVHSSLPKP